MKTNSYYANLSNKDEMSQQATRDEMRATRREWINEQLHKGYKTLSIIKMQVRIEEKFHSGHETWT